MGVRDWGLKVQNNIQGVFIGKDHEIQLVLASLLSGGHVLLDDVPGLGKTRLARALAQSLGVKLARIQCTPDLLPSDITGVSIYNPQDGSFKFRKGPVLNNFILVDEINRASPRTQSALLEAMAESQVSIEGKSLELPKPFFIIATQNPIDFDGTYPLPEAQKDRFLMTLSLGYPSREEETKILAIKEAVTDPLQNLTSVGSWDELPSLMEEVSKVHVSDAVRNYILDVVEATRSSPWLRMGVSPRGSLSLFRGAQAYAALQGRTFVNPDDVQALLIPVLISRILPKQGALVKGMTALEILGSIKNSVPVPVVSGLA